jgi:hypothetical protein
MGTCLVQAGIDLSTLQKKLNSISD